MSDRQQPHVSQARREPIAIVGMGCRFPGANGPQALWDLLIAGGDAISEVPADRFAVDDFYSAQGGPGKIVTRWGGFVKEADRFDAGFFRISPREAARMDPQHRLLLEVAWEAIEDAGLIPANLAGTNTGVFVGMLANDYEDLEYEDPANIDVYVTAGSARTAASGRVSYAFDLRGPSVVVDTACSSSLVAVHLACQSLASGSSDLAIAAGVNLILRPHATVGFSAAGMMAIDGHCKFADSRADGFVRSDGVGVVILKPLRRALADHDPIHALILGSAVNNDGRSSGFLMTPSQEGQEGVLREAYRQAHVAPTSVQYVEAHGTGTKVGDPVEIGALAAVLGRGRSIDQACRLGSVKTNIGHTEGAAGVAGLIKAVLCLQHETLPGNPQLQQLNPEIPWERIPITVSRDAEPWPEHQGPARAGVNSFGISGTNAHLILEAAPPEAARSQAPTSLPFLLPVSARSAPALEAVIRTYRDWLVPGTEVASDLADVCYTASVRRGHHDHRAAFVFGSAEELRAKLEAALEEAGRPGPRPGSGRRLVFVFPGQGSQWLGMGRELMASEPVFREQLERCDRAARAHVPWSIVDQLKADEGESLLHEIDVVQPVLFAIQVSLAALWRSWGIEPDAVVGHSMGEIAAAHVAGSLTLEDSLRIICVRSRLLRRISGRGAMAAVQMTVDQAQAMIEGHADKVSVAVCNSPTSTVLSGDSEVLRGVVDRLVAEGVFARMVNVDVASHSPQVDELEADLAAAIADLKPTRSAIPMYSTVLAREVDGRRLDASYWIDNLRRTVRFASTVELLSDRQHSVFLEMSGHPILSAAVQECCDEIGRESWTLASMRRGEERSALLASLASLYRLGFSVDWARLHGSGGKCVPLPAYPWQRERFWFDGEVRPPQIRRAPRPTGSEHPLLGPRRASAVHSETYFWDLVLSTSLYPYLEDHRVQDLPVFPAASYMDLVLAAARDLFGPQSSPAIERITFDKALFLPRAESVRAQLVLAQERPGAAAFQLLSASQGLAEDVPTWTLHAAGSVRRAGVTVLAPDAENLAIARASCQERMSAEDFYARMTERGLGYGPAFRPVEEIWRRDGEAVGRVCLPEAVATGLHGHRIPPPLLDGCLQVIMAAFSEAEQRGTYLPVGMRAVTLAEGIGGALWSHATIQPNPGRGGDRVEGDIVVLTPEGRPVAAIEGLVLQRLEAAGGLPDARLRTWLWEWAWEPKPGVSASDGAGRWLIFAQEHGIGPSLRSALAAAGSSSVLVTPGSEFGRRGDDTWQLDPARPEDFTRLLEEVGDAASLRGIAYLWGSETELPDGSLTTSQVEAVQTQGSVAAMHLAQAVVTKAGEKPPRLCLVTRGAQAAGLALTPLGVAQAPLLGLARVIAGEHPELRCKRIDLAPGDVAGEVTALVGELFCDDGEEEIALRAAGRLVRRLARWSPVSEAAIRSSATPQRISRPASGAGSRGLRAETTESAASLPFGLESSSPGLLDSLCLRARPRRAPGPGEVEIEVRATGLNFRDVMAAMGMLPGSRDGTGYLGIECAGTIVGLGAGVVDFALGDEVAAVARSSFGTHALTNAHLVVRKPAGMSFEQAATIPIAFLTAHYSIDHLARLQRGERILIHSAAGGVGLAAVSLARWVGAEVFATAGSPEKREFLTSMGIEHVLDSHSTEFADEVLRMTDGRGVDVVLNSLSGLLMTAGMAALAPYGRFVEIGKRDIFQNRQIGLLQFQKNLSFFAVDLDRMITERPEALGGHLREAFDLVCAGEVDPVPYRVLPITMAAEAFRQMAQGKHIGKIAVTFALPIPKDSVDTAISPAEDMLFAADETHLITGGRGGIGLVVARWMVDHGARHLALMGRRRPSEDALTAMDEMRAAGAEVTVIQGDVAKPGDVDRALATISASMPPLRGVFHAAAVLDDDFILRLDEERLRKVLAPKASGAWNLHTATLGMDLRWFVLFSSVVTILGRPGQGNYAAGSEFLDVLAQHRRQLGMPAISINWGMWSEVGLAFQLRSVERLAVGGMESMTPAQGLAAFELLLRQNPVQAAVMPMDWRKYRDFNPQAGRSPIFARLMDEIGRPQPGTSPTMRATILAADAKQRRSLVQSHLVEQVSRVLGLAPERLDPSQPLVSLGLDSLMAVELKNRIEVSLGESVPVTKFLRGGAVETLIDDLLARLSATEKASA